MDANAKILASIAKCDDKEKLRTWFKNAKRMGNAEVANAAFRKLISLVPEAKKGTANYDFWESINALEFFRSRPLSRTRQKIARVEIIQTMKDLVMSKKPGAGFNMLIELGMPELTAEAVVLRHPRTFDKEVRSAARDRLVSVGIMPDSLPEPSA